MPADKPTELSRIKLKNLNSTARPYDQQAFSPLDHTASWFSHLALAIYMFVVVNFDALAQASDIRIEKRQVIEDPAKTWTLRPVPLISKHSAFSTALPVGFRTWLWWSTCLLFLISMLWYRQAIFESKGDKLSSSTECRIPTQGLRHLFPSRLNACWQTDWAIENQTKKIEIDSPSLWSESIQPTPPHCQLAFAPGSGDIHVCCC